MAFDILVEHGGTGLKDFLAALVKPLQTNTNALKTFETEYRKRAKFNGQKIVLQAALNDIFGVTSPFIIIETNEDIGINTYIYLASELSPVYFNLASELDPVYFFLASELNTIEYDFKILIPVGIHTADLERRVRAEATLYKLVGTRFIIETY